MENKQLETIYKIRYYNKLMNENLAIVEAAAKGTDASFLPYVTITSGKYSVRKMKKFLNRVFETGDFRAGKKLREFYEAFLFCAIYCFGNKAIHKDEEHYCRYKRCETFQELINRARFFENDEEWYKEYKDLLKEEFEDYSNKSRTYNERNFEDRFDGYYSSVFRTDIEYICHTFFATLDSYYLLAYKKPIENIDQNSFQENEENFIREVEESDRLKRALSEDIGRNAGGESRETIQKKYIEEDSEASKTLEEEYAEDEEMWKSYDEFIQEVRTYNAESEASWDEFYETLPTEEEFLKYYSKLRSLYFEGYRINAKELEIMILNFLYTEKLGTFIDDDLLLNVIESLNKSRKHIAITKKRRHSK